ncbi:uncharacterized protein Jasper [Epargyreus clarus]|uniref:uncharacterized protein Jasper n=1 Tax=Epargyreus clarus TaxID=520877 RepID=UPI003C2DDA8E
MKMSKKVREYKAGDFIFAKVKGYPAWPARVQRPNGKKYFVYFYGTGETANLAPNMIFDYAENKDKFLSKAVKRRDFNDGVKQIEHDFANNVPLEQVIGVAMEVPEESANDMVNDSTTNDTIDESTADTTAAEDTTVAEEADVTTNTTAQNETMVEDSDEAGALVIDEGKKGRKSTVKPTGKETPKPVKEPKTPRGKKKEEAEESKEDDKKQEEIVSRSGRKIRPKRYIDEQTEDNATLPSPAPKKRRGASPLPEKEKEDKANKTDAKAKGKHFNAVTQAELEDLKEPFTSEEQDKENILIAYLPQGQYVGIKLFQSRPTTCKSEPARLQWDRQQAQNAITLKQQLEKGQITAQSVITQLVMDLNLTDEEKSTLDKERETEEKKSRVQFLKTEMKLIELEAKIKTCLCLEKADTDLCLKLLDEFTELDIKPLMLLKHPSCGETVKRLRAYVGNAPSWELSESAALLFAKQAHRIRRRADQLYRRVRELFVTPEGLSFWEFFSERVEQFKKVTAKLSPDELLEMVHEPIEMSVPTSHTMKASVEAANEEEPMEEDSSPKKKPAAKQKKTTNNSTPSKPPMKRQSSRRLAEEKEQEKEQNAEDKTEDVNMEDAEKSSKAAEEEKDTTEAEQNAEQTNSNEDASADDTQEESSKKDSGNDKIDDNNDDDESNKSDKGKTKEDSSDKSSKNQDSSDKAKNKDDSSDKKTKDNTDKTNEPEKGSKTKDDSDKTKAKEDSEKNAKTKEDSTEKGNKSKNNNKEKSKSKSPSPNEKDETKSSKETKANESGKSKEDRAEKNKGDKSGKEDKTEKSEDKEDEPRAKRSRESKKTDAPPPRSPTKRKSKF